LLDKTTLRVSSFVFLGLLAVAFLPWLQLSWDKDLFAGDALLGALYTSGLLAAIVLGYAEADSMALRGQTSLVSLHVLWIAASLSATVGLLQWFALTEPLGFWVVRGELGGRATGNLAQPNQLATLLLMGIVAFAYAYECKIIGRLGLLFGIAFLTLVLILTASRAGMLSVVVLGSFGAWKGHRGKLRLSPRLVMVWVATFFAATALLPYISEALLIGGGRGTSSLTQYSDRLTLWKQVGDGILQSPWVGYGWNRTPTAQMAGAISYPSSVTATNAHNFVLDLLAWVGIPLGLMLSGACAYWFCSRMWRVQQTNAVYAMACLLPFAVHSMLEYPFAYAYFLIVAGIMVGVVEASIAGTKTIALNVRAVRIALCAWAVVGSVVIYEYFQIEEDFRVVRFESFKIGKTAADYEVPKIRLLSHMGAMLTAARVTPIPAMDTRQIDNLHEAALRFPYGILSLSYATALGLNGDPVGASHQLQIIRGMYGEHYYNASKGVLRTLENEKYPQLGAIKMP
jgi:O-antigen ligase